MKKEVKKIKDLSSEEILAHKNFDGLKIGKQSYSSIIAVSSIVVIMAIIIGYFLLKSENNISPETVVESNTNEFSSFETSTIAPEAKDQLTIKNIREDIYWVTKNNTLVIIPKNGLIDKNGKEVLTDVTLEIIEYNDAFDAVLANIPMEYDSNGYTYNFKTGGMFDLKASRNGEELSIKKGEKVVVMMPTNQNDAGFNQYYLNNNAWEFKDTNKLTTLSLTTKKSEEGWQKAIDYEEKPIKLDFNINDFPELSEETVFYPLKNQKEQLKMLNNNEWEDFKIIKEKDSYVLVAISRDKDLKIKIKTSEEIEQLSKEKKTAKQEVEYITYGAIDEFMEEGFNINTNQLNFSPDYSYSAYKRAMVAEKVVNVFSINSFGIWNCDAPQRLPEGALLANMIFIDEETLDTITYKGDYYLSENDKQLLYKYYPNVDFKFNPKSDNLLWFLCLRNKTTTLFYAKEENFVKPNDSVFTMSKLMLNENEINATTVKKVLGL